MKKRKIRIIYKFEIQSRRQNTKTNGKEKEKIKKGRGYKANEGKIIRKNKNSIFTFWCLVLLKETILSPLQYLSIYEI